MKKSSSAAGGTARSPKQLECRAPCWHPRARVRAFLLHPARVRAFLLHPGRGSREAFLLHPAAPPAHGSREAHPALRKDCGWVGVCAISSEDGGGEAGEQDNTPPDRQEQMEKEATPEQKKRFKAIRRMHYNLAHPSRATLLRMLRSAGAKADSVDYPKCWKCPVCIRRERPKSARPAKAERAEKFNDCVVIDVKHVHDANMKKYVVLHFVDEATFYHVATLVDKADSVTSVVFFQNKWVAWAGVPKKIIHDQGGEFQYWCERYLERVSVDSFVVPTEAAWTERHGGILDNMITAIVEQRTLTTRNEMEEAVIAAAAAKNQLVRRSGYSPAQCVLATDVKLPGNVLDNIDEIPMHDQAMEDGPFKRALDMRETARIAYVKLQNSDALRSNPQGA